ncbi:OB-fold domain-containing protein [Ilumatobacter coccineus]|uniref:Hydroxymethylglutaryl-CoA synthase n=1 Tax=Ilumatobacter coccineus (strain NBRC 103263 / KCTC 29153 / YM16-304) TaxID=1313172 RepID=A0A6C7DZJ6_ILUCY|nr:OB-fold domain-containing protein [Ilumatobacter coccineus]BAN01534.1 hypothetical protein YM304_12200 [Ilumatobacter coccineus YM16-304]
MNGIVSYGVHLPYWRLDRSKITQTLGQGGGRGTRSVASFDEDATSMGVEAGRRALAAAAPGYGGPGILAYATTAPGYLDKTNATAIHAALRLDDCVPAFDVGGAAKSGTAATIMAHNGGIAVLSDVRTGRPGSADEAAGGDAAVALIFGDDAVIAEPVGYAPVTAEFVDRWRVPGESYSRQWEERFGEHAYVPLATQAVGDVLKQADVQIGDVDHAIVAGLHTRSVKAVSKQLGCAPERLADDLLDTIGNTGTAHWALMLANVLDQASPGDLVLVAHLADGCDASLLRVTDEIVAFRERQRSTAAEQLAATTTELDYSSFMTWRGFLEREPPRRPEPDRPASPPSLRGNAWKYGFVGGQDDGGFIHLPPGRVSVESGAIDEMTPVPMADRRATIATFTIDRLAYSLAPPVVAAIVDFDGGGRMQVELTDVDPAEVKIGDRVEMTFRRLYTVDGIHNHFWKARPVRS